MVEHANLGTLILAGTPIGNLSDASPRLGECLARAHAVFAEDTRKTRKLLTHFQISRPLQSFHEHSGPGTRDRIERHLRHGETVLFVSDAGMPGVSDPGYELVTLALNAGAEVDVVPGPCAVINALLLSGLPTHAFAFLGFFPRTQSGRESLLNRLPKLNMTTVHFESPQRIRSTVEMLCHTIPQTPIAVCREMTKLHQQTLRGLPHDLCHQLKSPKGEFVLVIAPVKQLGPGKGLQQQFDEMLRNGMSQRQAIKRLSQDCGLKKRDLLQQIHLPAPVESKADDHSE